MATQDQVSPDKLTRKIFAITFLGVIAFTTVTMLLR